MLKPKRPIKNKVIILIIALVLVITNFTLLCWPLKKAQAGAGVVSAPILEWLQESENMETFLERLKTEVQSEVKGVFFKNILGQLMNQMAQETAVWLATGGKGQAPLFITNPSQYWQGAADKAIGEFIARTVYDITKLNVCTMTPQLALQLSLKNPFAQWGDRAKDNAKNIVDNPELCTWTQLQDHWDEVGKNMFKDFSFNLDQTAGGDFGRQVELMNKTLPEDDRLSRFRNQLVTNPAKILVQMCVPPFTPVDNNTKIKCPGSGPAAYTEIMRINKLLQDDTQTLNQDLNIVVNGLNQPLSKPQGTDITGQGTVISGDSLGGTADYSGFREEEVTVVRDAWLEALKGHKNEIEEKLGKVFRACANVKTFPSFQKETYANCASQLGLYLPVETRAPEATDEVLKVAYVNEITEKAKFVMEMTDYLASGYNYLIKETTNTLHPDNVKGAIAYDWKLLNDMFDQPNDTSTYFTLTQEMASKGMSEFANTRLQSLMDAGWMPLEKTVSGDRKMPASATETKVEEDVVKAPKTSAQYTKDIVADALGIFLDTLTSELQKNLMNFLLGDKTEQEKNKKQRYANVVESGETVPLPDILYNPYQQEVNTVEGFRSFVTKTAKRYTSNFIITDLNLLAEFQLSVSGRINPNIYNKVIDSNLAVAINGKMTIRQALEEQKLIKENHFSWGATVEEGTYHLANIKKLRKARVVPLGLELAIELIRDCNYRKTFNGGQYANFSDINYSAGRSMGGLNNAAAFPFQNQRLQNCIFRPASSEADDPLSSNQLTVLQEYNIKKMNEVLNATLGTVVDGYSTAGTGICGDFDDAESPFCNLVDSEWVLKIPFTKCATQVDLEPYGEILQSNETGQRYSRCPDFISCLKSDSSGGCYKGEYGVCVKEKNVWQFNAATCPAEYSSCTAYTQKQDNKNVEVAYLKNTLSGSDYCGPDNAGCLWYSTKTKAGNLWQDYASYTNESSCREEGGTWQNNHCLAERIYLNGYASSCSATKEGCNEFTILRNPNNNMVADSSFEYTEAGRFPAGWDLYKKTEINVADSCLGLDNQPGRKYAVCLNYDYAAAETVSATAQVLCSSNNGTWVTTEGNPPVSTCTGAIKILDINKLAAEQTDCTTAGHGDVKIYCLASILQYNLCENPQFTNQADCQANDGIWAGECQIATGVAPELANQANCENNSGTWHESCSGAKIYFPQDQTAEAKQNCQNLKGIWQGSGPFSTVARVTKGGEAQSGLSKLEIEIGNLAPNEKLQLSQRVKLSTDQILTKAGDIYTAAAYLKANRTFIDPVTFSLVKSGPDEINSKYGYLNTSYNQILSTLVTAQPGNQLNIIIDLPSAQGAGSTVYLDNVDLYINTPDQIASGSFYRDYRDYDNNTKFYYKKPPSVWNCHGYQVGDPPPVLPITQPQLCTGDPYFGFWDADGQFTFGLNKNVCYKYKPDDAACDNFLKVCLPEEVGCQIYRPLNGDPEVPGVISTLDYCPTECVGYNAYTVEATLYDPLPEPLYNYFIPQNAKTCLANEVGCTQFTNLDTETVEYYTYMRQCIKPNLDLGEKSYFTWQGSVKGGPQIVKYQFQAEGECLNPAFLTKSDCTANQSQWVLGAPKLIDEVYYKYYCQNDSACIANLKECDQTDLNCVKLYDDQGNIYYRDIRKTVSVSDNCHPYRKTLAANLDQTRIAIEQTNCGYTNGRWQDNACIYDVIPSEGSICRAEANGCRSYKGNRGNNVNARFLDNFEETNPLDWYITESGTDTGLLAKVGESLIVGGHSLSVPTPVTAIHKNTEIQTNRAYMLSFWAKSDITSGVDELEIKFSTAVSQGTDTANTNFAVVGDNKVQLTNQWKYYTLGPVFVTWQNTEGNSLIIKDINSQIYLDNVFLKVIRDNVYVVKDSWTTPLSCDRNIYGVEEKYAMLGCQSYQDLGNNRYNLKSFSSLCRSSAVGCQILIDTKNSTNPYQQSFNGDNSSYLDDYTVPADDLVTLVLNEKHGCATGTDSRGNPISSDKGCQRLGKPAEQTPTELKFTDVYLRNDPDKYINVPKANMCNVDGYGCSELINSTGSFEYYRIIPEKLCHFAYNSETGINGWFKNNNVGVGCATYDYDQTNCPLRGGYWSGGQCLVILNDIEEQEICEQQRNIWLGAEKKCLAWPYNIFKVNEANKYKDYVGQCDGTYDGCTEFVDVNPNYIFNGGFEAIDLANNIASWQAVVGGTGNKQVETADVKVGKQALKLIKYTDADCPSTAVYPDCSAPTYAVAQKVGRLEAGKTYKISFYYKVPADAKGTGPDCAPPQVAFQFNSLAEKPAGTRAVPGKVYTYDAEEQWKKVEFYYTVSSFYGLLQDYELLLYAPLNYNTKTNQGNCRDSYVLYDQVEVKENVEDSYYILDASKAVNRSDCSTVDWKKGCVQFLNTLTDEYELLKVNKDRDCAEWAFCQSKCDRPYDDNGSVISNKADCEGNGRLWDDAVCTVTNVCTMTEAGECIRTATKNDNVRYDIEGEPLVVKRIANPLFKQGYIYRYGTSSLSRLVEWRAGDYSGYTIPNRLPLEQEIMLPKNQRFTTYEQLNNLDQQADKDIRFESPVCKIFPAVDSPLPYDLAQKPEYKNLRNTFSQKYLTTELGNMCSYEQAKAGSYWTYLPINGSRTVTKICTAPESQRGKICSLPTDCGAGVESKCSEIEQVKPFYGLEDMCLEFDSLSPIYSDLYRNIYGTNSYQPYACLSYFPFMIDLCYMHANETSCLVNPECNWTANACVLKVDRAAPALSIITPVGTPTTISNPTFTFSSSKAGRIFYDGVCRSTTAEVSLFPSPITTLTLGTLSGSDLAPFADGTYSLGTPVNPKCRIRVVDNTGNTSEWLNINSFTIDTTAPILNLAEGESATKILAAALKTFDFNFTATEAGSITYSDSAFCYGSLSQAEKTTGTSVNTTTITLTAGTSGTCTIQVSDGIGNVSNSLSIVITRSP